MNTTIFSLIIIAVTMTYGALALSYYQKMVEAQTKASNLAVYYASEKQAHADAREQYLSVLERAEAKDVLLENNMTYVLEARQQFVNAVSALQALGYEYTVHHDEVLLTPIEGGDPVIISADERRTH